jgi:putative transposase
VRERIREIANKRRRFGYWRLALTLKREGKGMNPTKVYRLYREERLAVRKRGGRKRAPGTRAPMPIPIPREPNQRSSLDFAGLIGLRPAVPYAQRHRRLQPGMLGVYRLYIAELSAIAERRAALHGRQRQWHRVDQSRRPRLVPGRRDRLALHRAGKPQQNGYVEAFNGPLRDEYLTEHLYPMPAAARRIIKAWWTDYNTERPHSSLGGLAPTVPPPRGHMTTDAKLSAA